MDEEEANEYIEELRYLVNEGLSIEEITEEFISITGRDYHLFGIIDI